MFNILSVHIYSIMNNIQESTEKEKKSILVKMNGKSIINMLESDHLQQE